jgi:hypothetical protein
MEKLQFNLQAFPKGSKQCEKTDTWKLGAERHEQILPSCVLRNQALDDFLRYAIQLCQCRKKWRKILNADIFHRKEMLADTAI